MTTPYRILCIAPSMPDLWDSPFGPFVVESCASLDDAARFDAMYRRGPDGATRLGPEYFRGTRDHDGRHYETAARAGVAPEAVQAIYFTGGSSRLGTLAEAIAAPFPQAERVRQFVEILESSGTAATVRKRKGADIDAACGQLAGQVQDRTRRTVRLHQARENMR